MTQFDDAWYEEWKQRMEDGGGNVILALGLRPTHEEPGYAVMEMPYGPNVRQGTGVFAAGALIQLADVAGTIACRSAIEDRSPDEEHPFPLCIQINSNLMRNTDRGKAITETRVVSAGRTIMVTHSDVKDDEGRLLATVSATYVVAKR